MLDPTERQRRTRIAFLAGLTGFVLVSLLLMIMTPSGRTATEVHQRWLYIAQVAIAAGLLTMSLTFFLIRRRR